MNAQTIEHWIDGGAYSFRLDGDTIIAKNAKGRVLKTIPPKARATAAFQKVDMLRAYLHQHEVLCGDTVRDWFLKGLPVPLPLITAVWPDPAWQKYFRDLVVVAAGATGLLRGADANGLQLVDLDGETVSVPFHTDLVVHIPHPATMDEIDDWREFAVELGITQGLDQLFREVHVKPSDVDGIRAALGKYQGAKYKNAQTLIGRSRGGGFDADMNSISLTVLEDGVETTAMLETDSWYYDDEATLHSLSFTRSGRVISAEDVGPIAWSEGVRMCEFVYAGRVTHEPNPTNS